MSKSENHIAAIDTPLGKDTLLLESAILTEQFDALFEYEVELKSEEWVDFDGIVGKNVTIGLELADDERRYFNGMVSQFARRPEEGRYFNYRATIVPWTWSLTQTADCRIFQNQTVPEIIAEVFRANGMSDFEMKLSADYRKRDYCVQYRETDFNFISRLMEDEGIYYYFQHDSGKHTMVLADSIATHEKTEGFESLPFNPNLGGGEQNSVYQWEGSQQIQPGQYSVTDFNFAKPRSGLRAVSAMPRDHDHSEFPVFDYPGVYREHDEGERISRVRLEAMQTGHQLFEGLASCRGLAVGSLFDLVDHFQEDQNGTYVITGTAQVIRVNLYESGDAPPATYHCQFSCLAGDVPYRSQRRTPKPLISGPQTAIVTGPKNEEIHTDEYGRVKAHFHWDRYNDYDDKSSCWIRVSQGWAGKRWGAFSLPRIGQEVIVEFLEGDPDRPIITGRVYNGDAMPPYKLPAHKTLTTVKSNSSKGGKGFNEVRFEDKKGEEQVFIHAEKNQDIRVKNNTYETIGADRHLVVGQNQVEKVENNREEIVGNDHLEKIEKDRHLKVEGKEAKGVGGGLSLTVGGDIAEVFKSNHSEQTAGETYVKASTIVLEAAENITLKVGGSFVAIDASGVKIGGIQVVGEGEAMLELKAPMINGDASGIMDLKGGLIRLN